jgi:thymidylate kinase
MHRVALEGIDGSGKTTVAAVLRRRARANGLPLAVLHTIRPHDNDHGPHRALSQRLTVLSEAADRLSSPELKIGTFYLQLCTFRSIERDAIAVDGAEIILSDRHPIVDSLVYLPLYARVAASRPLAGPPDGFARIAASADPAALSEALAWATDQGCGSDLWALGRDLLALGASPLDVLTKEVTDRLGVGLPDEVVLLDVSVSRALDRLRGREQASELHESQARLSAIRQRYTVVLDWLTESLGVRIRTLSCDDLTVADTADALWPALSSAD